MSDSWLEQKQTKMAHGGNNINISGVHQKGYIIKQRYLLIDRIPFRRSCFIILPSDFISLWNLDLSFGYGDTVENTAYYN